jgi:hypothetical protein
MAALGQDHPVDRASGCAQRSEAEWEVRPDIKGLKNLDRWCRF